MSKKACNFALVLLLLTIVSAEGSDKPLKEISPIEIFAKIGTGLPVEYDHVLIRGDLNLSQLNLPTIKIERKVSQVPCQSIMEDIRYSRASENMTLINSTIKVSYSRIEGKVSLENAVFLKQVDFSNTEFTQASNFSSCQFDEWVYFANSLFDSDVTFRAAQFNKGASFDEADFNKGANFISAEILNAFFGSANFKGPCSFKGTKFFKNADFRSANFYQNADYQDVYFGGDTRFSKSHFWKNSSFQNADFLGRVNVLEISFKELDNFSLRFSEIPEKSKPIQLGFTGDFLTTGRLASYGNITLYEAKMEKEKGGLMEIRENGNILLENKHNNFYINISKPDSAICIILRNCTNFSISKYKESINFRQAVFDGETKFADENGERSCEFTYDANFTKSLFGSNVLFPNVRFNNNAYFTGAKFDKLANFHGVEFLGCAQFSGARFNETVNFWDILFGGCVILDRITCNETVDFNGVQFRG